MSKCNKQNVVNTRKENWDFIFRNVELRFLIYFKIRCDWKADLVYELVSFGSSIRTNTLGFDSTRMPSSTLMSCFSISSFFCRTLKVSLLTGRQLYSSINSWWSVCIFLIKKENSVCLSRIKFSLIDYSF